ncbi:MAG: VTT domain-containing protein [Pseudomonadota bacterium]
MDFAAWYLELRGWLIQHPDAILISIFLVALIEAVAVVGVIVPAVPLLFVLCVLAAHADVALLPVFIAGIGGAMLGDGISYALGKGFKDSIHRVWPFTRFPAWLARAEEFVASHGGKSIILGRFIGPLRAFVPLAAGVFRMKPLYFLWMNLLSALAWAPTHLLPGYSLGAAARNAWLPGRDQLLFVACILILVAVLTWLLPVLQGRRQRAASRAPLANTGRYQTRAGLPEEQRDALRLAAAAGIAFLVLAVGLPLLRPLDIEWTQALFRLRQDSLDHVFVALSLLGERQGLLAFATVLGGWLALRRQWQTLVLLGMVCVIGLTVPAVLKQLFAVVRPQWVQVVPAAMSFPSGHAFNAVMVWGLVLVLVLRHGNDTVSNVARPLLLSLMLLTLASRPYLGVHWVSDVVGGGLLGLACLALLRWGWHRLPAPTPALPETLAVLATALAVSLIVAVFPHLDIALLDYRPLPLPPAHLPPP